MKEIDYNVSSISLANQTANRALSLLLREVAANTWGKQNEGLNEVTKKYSYKLDGSRTEEDKPKYDIVTFHSSRDTFITNCLISGVDLITVMSWSGHTKFETFRKYIKLSDAYNKLQHKKVDNLFKFKKSVKEAGKEWSKHLSTIKSEVEKVEKSNHKFNL